MMFIESDKHIYYNTRYIEKYYRSVNQIRIVMHDGEDELLYGFKTLAEVSVGMQVLNHLLRNESSVVTRIDYMNQVKEECISQGVRYD